MDLENDFNFTYKATLNIGNPPAPVRAIMDTGSSNTWVLSDKAVTDDDKFEH